MFQETIASSLLSDTQTFLCVTYLTRGDKYLEPINASIRSFFGTAMITWL